MAVKKNCRLPVTVDNKSLSAAAIVPSNFTPSHAPSMGLSTALFPHVLNFHSFPPKSSSELTKPSASQRASPPRPPRMQTPLLVVSAGAPSALPLFPSLGLPCSSRLSQALLLFLVPPASWNTFWSSLFRKFAGDLDFGILRN